MVTGPPVDGTNPLDRKPGNARCTQIRKAKSAWDPASKFVRAQFKRRKNCLRSTFFASALLHNFPANRGPRFLPYAKSRVNWRDQLSSPWLPWTSHLSLTRDRSCLHCLLDDFRQPQSEVRERGVQKIWTRRTPSQRRCVYSHSRQVSLSPGLLRHLR